MKAGLYTSILFVLIVTLGNAQNVSDKKKYKDKHLTFTYPASWELNEEGLMGTKLIILSPQEDSLDNFRENMNLIIQDISGNKLSLEEYTKLSINQVKTLMTDVDFKGSHNTTINGQEFQVIEYTAQQGQFTLHFVQQFTIIKNKAYIFTFSAQEKDYLKYANEGKKILESIIF